MIIDFKIASRHKISENDLSSSDKDIKHEDTAESNAAFPLVVTAIMYQWRGKHYSVWHRKDLSTITNTLLHLYILDLIGQNATLPQSKLTFITNLT